MLSLTIQIHYRHFPLTQFKLKPQELFKYFSFTIQISPKYLYYYEYIVK